MISDSGDGSEAPAAEDSAEVEAVDTAVVVVVAVLLAEDDDEDEEEDFFFSSPFGACTLSRLRRFSGTHSSRRLL